MILYYNNIIILKETQLEKRAIKIKNQNFGIEIEMTDITLNTATKVFAGYFHTTTTHIDGSYDSYLVRDDENR